MLSRILKPKSFNYNLRAISQQQMFTQLPMRGYKISPVIDAMKEPKTLSELRAVGMRNLAQSKTLNYEELFDHTQFGLGSQADTYQSFEDQINSQYELEENEPMTRHSKRAGLIGYKMGCTHYYDKWGKQVPCTVIQVDRCQVTQVFTEEKDGRNAVQVGAGEPNLKHMNKAQIGHLLKYNLPAKKDLAEFKVTPDMFIPIGYCLGPRHFQIGQYVDIKSVSKGKGYQGTMKRWNFSGQNATHGNSRAHRLPGSIGMCEFPGKVFKGKKMAGQMGNKNCTVQSQLVVGIDTKKSLLYIRGNVPGSISSLVKVQDACKKIDEHLFNLQYPTFLPPKDPAAVAALPQVQMWEGNAIDPYENFIHENDVVSGRDQDAEQ